MGSCLLGPKPWRPSNADPVHKTGVPQHDRGACWLGDSVVVAQTGMPGQTTSHA
eukprot:XP_001690477.1 predicted protein [Chlamydomonas reinhardtii]